MDERLDAWPAPPAHLIDFTQLQAYAETLFLANVLHSDIELYLGPSSKLQSTWDRAVSLQQKLALKRSALPPAVPASNDPITLEGVKRAVDLADIFSTQMTHEIIIMYGAGAHPADQLSITVGTVREVIDMLTTLSAVADRVMRADQVMQRVTPRVSLIDDTWLQRTRPHHSNLPPLVKGPGYVEPRVTTQPATTFTVGDSPLPRLADAAVTGLHGAEPSLAWVDEARQFEKTGRLQGIDEALPANAVSRVLKAIQPKNDLKDRLHNPTRGVIWVLAADYTRFRSWCQDHNINHLDKHLVAFPSPGLWEHHLCGVTDPWYALGHGWEARPDKDLFLAFMEERGGQEWLPPR